MWVRLTLLSGNQVCINMALATVIAPLELAEGTTGTRVITSNGSLDVKERQSDIERLVYPVPVLTIRNDQHA